ncbi:hypothetical protein RND81_01G028300 [Saponaria officinalis]|uniref:Peptidase A1 domain-containing protein n=1 Tax=Saponaria officinalis TaxID=3572 RepID=A0AAW1NFT8_SAPOF
MSSTNFFICFLLFSTLFSSFSSSKPITLNLSPIPKLVSSLKPREVISHIAKSTLKRAIHLKYHNKYTLRPTYSTPLFAQSAGDYSISLSIGTPPQKIPAFFDTGSSLVWVPCTSRYSCLNCTQNNEKITTFLPKKSTSKVSVKCNDKKCRWLDQPNVMASCPTCTRSIPDSCSKPCSYIQAYGSGATLGDAIFESLNLDGKVVPDFFVGCSSISELMPEGIIGFGRSPTSLPNQLKIGKFSHCLVSHKFDDTPKSSRLILGDTGVLIPGVKYTPLLKNPPVLPFNEYYYVSLEQITVGKRIVKVPHDIHVPDPNGNGGTIVDSGSTLTSIVPNVFDPIVEEFMTQMSPAQQKRVEIAEASIGNILCVNVKGLRKPAFPKVVFHFKGGAKMLLSVANYFNGGANYLCLPFLNATFAVGQGGSGPAIIVGNYQQQNYYIEYDLKNERLGLKKQNCLKNRQ